MQGDKSIIPIDLSSYYDFRVLNAQNAIHNYTIQIQQSSDRIRRLQNELKSKDRTAIVYIILIATVVGFGCIISILVVVYRMQRAHLLLDKKIMQQIRNHRWIEAVSQK